MTLLERVRRAFTRRMRFRRSQTNLDGVLGARASRSRVTRAQYTRAAHTKVNWPPPVPHRMQGQGRVLDFDDRG